MLAILGACGGTPQGAGAGTASGTNPRAPRLEDVLDPDPEALLVVRGRAVRRDPVFGPEWRLLLQEALARGHGPPAASRSLDVWADAEAVIVTRGPDGYVVALRSVRADVDPARLADDGGNLLWEQAATNGVVTEYHSTGSVEPPLRLFVLPGRQWVVVDHAGAPAVRRALGGQARRASAALDLPALDEREPSSLAFLWLRGDTTLAIAPGLRHGALAGVGRRLRDLVISLPPGREDRFRIALLYVDEDAALAALDHVEQAVRAAGLATPPVWLHGAAVTREGDRVVLALPLARIRRR